MKEVKTFLFLSALLSITYTQSTSVFQRGMQQHSDQLQRVQPRGYTMQEDRSMPTVYDIVTHHSQLQDLHELLEEHDLLSELKAKEIILIAPTDDVHEHPMIKEKIVEAERDYRIIDLLKSHIIPVSLSDKQRTALAYVINESANKHVAIPASNGLIIMTDRSLLDVLEPDLESEAPTLINKVKKGLSQAGERIKTMAGRAKEGIVA